MSRPGLFTSVIAWLDEKAPHDPRILRLLDFVLPLLITALLVVNLVQIGKVGSIAEEARNSGQTAQRASRKANHFAGDLRQGLVDNCEKNGNPLREVLIEEQEGAIESPRDPDIRALLPNTPQSVINRIVRKSNREHRERTEKLTPVDCQRQYPKQHRGASGSRR